MLMLAFVFQTLSRRRPDLDAGIYAYAKAGFGNYLGFVAAFGYWLACCLACLACLVLIKATLGQFFAVFGDGSTPVAIASASLLLWGVHLLVHARRQAGGGAEHHRHGGQDGADRHLHRRRHLRLSQPRSLRSTSGAATSPACPAWPSQVRNTMLVTVFVFVGIEGASVYSRYAKDRNDVGVATVLGFLGVLCLLMLVTLLSYGILPRAGAGGPAQPVDGRRDAGHRRPLGRGLHQPGPDRLGARQLPVVDAARRRGAAFGGAERHHAGLPGARERATACRTWRCG